MSLKIVKILILYLFISSSCFSKETVSIVFSERVSNVAHFFMDEIEKIYTNLGINPKIKIFPESRALHLFRNSKVDAVGVKIEEFEDLDQSTMKVNVPVLKNLKFKIYVLKKDIERVRKLKNPYIITSKECLGCIEFAKNFKVRVSSYIKEVQTGLRLLELKRADLMIASEVTVNSYSKGMYVPYDNKVFKSDLYHFISKRKGHLKKSLEEEFKRAVKRNAFDIRQVKVFD